MSGKPKATTGITLRLDKEMLTFYEGVAARANQRERTKGGRGNLSAQDVMRHWLASLPAYRVSAGKKSRFRNG